MPIPKPEYTRITQVTGEIFYIREMQFKMPKSPSYTAPYSGFSKTGDACISINGQSPAGFGISYEESLHVRGGFYLRFVSPLPVSGTTVLFSWTSVNEDRIGVDYVRANWELNTISVVLDDVETQISFVDLGFTADIWIRIGFDFDPTRWFVLYVNGNSVFSQNVAVVDQSINGFFFGGYGYSAIIDTFYVDDFYLDRVDFEYRSVCPPNRIFLSAKVSGPGTFAQWTPYGEVQNWRNVDDATIPDGDTTQNYTNAVDRKDTYQMTSISVPEAPDSDFWKINAVIPVIVAKRYNVAQQMTLKPILFDGINTGYAGEEEYLGPDYLVTWARHTEQPDGSSWSEDDINNMEVGYESGGNV